MTGTSYSPDINPTLGAPDFRTNQQVVPGTRQEQTRDKLDRFLTILGDNGYKPDSYSRIIENLSGSPSTNNFVAALNAMEKILQGSKFRRGVTGDDLQEAHQLYASIVADCGVTATTGKYNYSRSVQIRQGYEALNGQPATSLNTDIDPRSLYANSPGRNAFTSTESTSLSTKLGLPVDMIMNPDGYGFNQAILGLILRMTKDTKTYDQLKTDPANEPDGVSKTLSYADLVKKKPGDYTAAEYHAILSAFKTKTGIDNTWSTVDVGGNLVPNKVLLDFFLEQAQARRDPSEKVTMIAAVKYLTLAANQGTRELIAARNPAGTPNVPGAPVDPTVPDQTAF